MRYPRDVFRRISTLKGCQRLRRFLRPIQGRGICGAVPGVSSLSLLNPRLIAGITPRWPLVRAGAALHHARVTSKRRKWAIVIASVAVVSLVFFALNPRGEGPVYEGRHLSEWVEIQGRLFTGSVSGTDVFRSEEVIKNADTNAFPFLLKWVQHEDNHYRYNFFRPFRFMLSDRRFRNLTTSPATARADGAAAALTMLNGQFTSDMLAELERLTDNLDTPQTAQRATRALAAAGPAGLRSLAVILQDPQHPARHFAYGRMVEMYWNNRLKPEASVCVPGLIQYMTNTNGANAMPPSWVSHAGVILSNLNVKPDTYVSTLTTNLQNADATVRSSAALTLPRFGADAVPAVGALKERLSDSDLSVRKTATNALLQIAPESLTNAPPP